MSNVTGQGELEIECLDVAGNSGDLDVTPGPPVRLDVGRVLDSDADVLVPSIRSLILDHRGLHRVCCAPLSPRRSNAKRPTRRIGWSATSSGVNPSHHGADAHPNNRPKCFCQS
jgi:hypothetical protein